MEKARQKCYDGKNVAVIAGSHRLAHLRTWEAFYSYSDNEYLLWQTGIEEILHFDNIQDLRQYIKDKGLKQ